jgi:hypothetical protein
VARLTAAATPRKPIRLGLLQSLTATLPPQADSADLVRALRDDERW